MSKHEKRLTWDVPEHEFAEAKVKRLEAENKKLKDTVKVLERELARMDRVYDNSADRSSEIIEIRTLRSSS